MYFQDDPYQLLSYHEMAEIDELFNSMDKNDGIYNHVVNQQH